MSNKLFKVIVDNHQYYTDSAEVMRDFLERVKERKLKEEKARERAELDALSVYTLLRVRLMSYGLGKYSVAGMSFGHVSLDEKSERYQVWVSERRNKFEQAMLSEKQQAPVMANKLKWITVESYEAQLDGIQFGTVYTRYAESAMKQLKYADWVSNYCHKFGPIGYYDSWTGQLSFNECYVDVVESIVKSFIKRRLSTGEDIYYQIKQNMSDPVYADLVAAGYAGLTEYYKARFSCDYVELVQTHTCPVWLSLDAYRYIRRVVARECDSQLVRHSRRCHSLERAASIWNNADEVQSVGEYIDSIVNDREESYMVQFLKLESIQEAIGTVKRERDRTVAKLLVEGYSYEECAEIVGVHLATIYRITKRLEKHFVDRYIAK